MKRTLISCAVGAALLGATLLPVVFHAQPGSPRSGAPAATPAAAAASPAATAAAAAASPEPQRFPHMAAAVRHLEQAKQELDAAEPVFHGHREKAIELVNHALEECHKGMESAR